MINKVHYILLINRPKIYNSTILKKLISILFNHMNKLYSRNSNNNIIKAEILLNTSKKINFFNKLSSNGNNIINKS